MAQARTWPTLACLSATHITFACFGLRAHQRCARLSNLLLARPVFQFQQRLPLMLQVGPRGIERGTGTRGFQLHDARAGWHVLAFAHIHRHDVFGRWRGQRDAIELHCAQHLWR